MSAPPIIDTETFQKNVLDLEKQKLTYYTEKTNVDSAKQYDENLFINLSIRAVFENISKTFVGIMNDLTAGDRDYLAIISKQDRLIYVGIIILFFAFCVYLIDITG